MNNHWNIGERWKITFLSHYDNEIFRIYLSLIWYLVCISCKLINDTTLTRIFKFFAISSKTMLHSVPEGAHCVWSMSLGDFCSCFSKTLLKMVNITNIHLEYRIGLYCPYVVIHRVQIRYFDENMPPGRQLLLPELWPPNSAYLKPDGLRHMGNIGRLGIQGQNSWYWPSWWATWISMSRTLPVSFIKHSTLLQGQNATLFSSWWQKTWISALKLYH